MRLPRLVFPRTWHLLEREVERAEQILEEAVRQRDEARGERNEALTRVVELEQAIRGHLATGTSHQWLRRVLDGGHDRQGPGRDERHDRIDERKNHYDRIVAENEARLAGVDFSAPCDPPPEEDQA